MPERTTIVALSPQARACFRDGLQKIVEEAIRLRNEADALKGDTITQYQIQPAEADAQTLLAFLSEYFDEAFVPAFGWATEERLRVEQLLAWERVFAEIDEDPNQPAGALSVGQQRTFAENAAGLLAAGKAEAESRYLQQEAQMLTENKREESAPPQQEKVQPEDKSVAKTKTKSKRRKPRSTAAPETPPEDESEDQTKAKVQSSRSITDKVVGHIAGFFRDRIADPREALRVLLNKVEKETIRQRHKDPALLRQVTVHIRGYDPQRHQLYQQAVMLEPDFERNVRLRLEEARLELPPNIGVNHELYEPGKDPPKRLGTLLEKAEVYVEFRRRSRPRKRPKPKKGHITVLEGLLEDNKNPEGFDLPFDRDVTIGRQKVVREGGTVVRYNTIAFMDSKTPDIQDESERRILRSISRNHAVIRYHTKSDVYQIMDTRLQSSSHTIILREGHSPIKVGRMPVTMENGDEIMLGKARLKFER